MQQRAVVLESPAHTPLFLSSVPAPTRPERYDDPWRYDPRFTGSFDDDPEPHRDPYGEEADRRSVHSERSAQSLRSSFSSHSRQVGALFPSFHA